MSLKKITISIAGVVAAVALATVAVRTYPDVRRYLNMRRM